MLDFAQFLLQEHIDYSSYNLQHKFDYFNTLLFENKIPKCPIMWDGDPSGHLKTASGVTLYRFVGRTLTPGSLSIHICTAFKRTEQSLDSIVIHEMIHAYLAANGQPNAGHNFMFQTMAHECQRKTGIPISLSDDISDLELLDDETTLCTVILAKTNRAHAWYAAFMTGTALDIPAKLSSVAADMASAQRFNTGDEIYILKADTSLSRKYHIVRTVSDLAGITDAEAQSLLQHGKIIQRIEARSVDKATAAGLAQPRQALVVLAHDPHWPDKFEVSAYTPTIAKDQAKMTDFLERWQKRTYAGKDVKVLMANSPLVTSKNWTLQRDYKSGSYTIINAAEAAFLMKGSKLIHQLTSWN